MEPLQFGDDVVLLHHEDPYHVQEMSNQCSDCEVTSQRAVFSWRRWRMSANTSLFEGSFDLTSSGWVTTRKSLLRVTIVAWE